MQFLIKNKKFLLGAIGFVVSIILIYLISEKVDFDNVFKILFNVSPVYIVLMVTIYLSSFIFRAIRWKLMIKKDDNINFNNCFKAIVIGFAGNNFIPARGGELLRMEVFSRNTKLNRVTTISSVLIEKIIDGLVLVLFLQIVLAFNTEFLNENWMQNLALFSTFLFISMISILIFLRIYGHLLISFIDNKKSKPFQILKELINKINSAILFIDWSFNSFQVLILSLFIWIVECIVFYIAFFAFEIGNFPIYESLLTLSVVNFGILIPSSPAYIGVFQAMIILALMLFSIDENTALSLGILIHSCQFFPVTILGVYFLLKQSRIFNKVGF